MKKYILIILTILSVSCHNKTKEKIESEQEPQLSTKIDTKLTVSFSFDNYFKLEKYNLDSINTYGAGDCWGTVSQYSKDNLIIGLDSMMCSEYGYSIRKILFNEDGLVKAYLLKSNTLLGLDGEENKYELTEIRIELDNLTSQFSIRKDTILEPKIELITTKFKIIENDNLSFIVEDIINSYKGNWEMTEDF